MKKVFIISLLVLLSCKEKQIKKSILNDCLSIEQAYLLNKMIFSFEDDICKYYDLSLKESDEVLLTYLININHSENFYMEKEIASDRSKELLKKSFEVLSDDVWISYEEENNSKGVINVYQQNALKKNDTVKPEDVSKVILEDDFELDIHFLEKREVLKDRLVKDSMNRSYRVEKLKNVHFLRIYGKLVDCIYKTTTNEPAKNLYDGVLAAGRISPLIFIDGLINLEPKDLNSTEIKVFIALSLFYSPLDFELNTSTFTK